MFHRCSIRLKSAEFKDQVMSCFYTIPKFLYCGRLHCSASRGQWYEEVNLICKCSKVVKLEGKSTSMAECKCRVFISALHCYLLPWLIPIVHPCSFSFPDKCKSYTRTVLFNHIITIFFQYKYILYTFSLSSMLCTKLFTISKDVPKSP